MAKSGNRRTRACAAWLALAATSGCAFQLVSPYNQDLAQRASTLQAEISAWDLTMFKSGGTAPGQVATIDGWRGQQQAMLTLALSNDPGTVPCARAAASIAGAVEALLPSQIAARPPPQAALAGTAGCETALVEALGTALDALDRTLALDCPQTGLAPPPSCAAAFRPAPGVPAKAAEFGHGRAVSPLLTLVQAIVYIEQRKRAAGGHAT